MGGRMIRAIVVSFVLLLSAPSSTPAEEKPLVIRFSTQAPPNSPQIQSLVHFKQRVEADSQGSIAIELYDSGKLYEDNQIAAAVRSGVIEMGYVNLSRYGEIIQIADAFYLPFLFANADVEKASRAPKSEMRRLIDDAILSVAGARVLWWVPEGQIVLLANNLSLADPDRLLGKSVRISGPTMAEGIQLCGGQPKDIPATEQPRAYEKGEVDVGMTSISAVMARKLWRSMNTITRTGHAISNFVVVINEKFWMGLSEKQKTLIASAAAIADTEAAEFVVRFEADAHKKLTEDGVKVVTLTDDQLQLWRICSSDVLSQFMEKSGELGEKLMAAYGRLQQDPCCNHAATSTITAPR
jgi:C4-dicarboxylate-binding protein DctP